MLGCGFQSNLNEDGGYWFTLPDGRRIVYTSVDSIAVVEFVSDISSEAKQDAIDKLGLQFVPIRVKRTLPVQSIDETIVVFRYSTGNYAEIHENVKRNFPNQIRGILPAFEHARDLDEFYPKPVAWLILSFNDDVTSNKRKEIVEKFNYEFLSVHHRNDVTTVAVFKQDTCDVKQRFLRSYQNQLHKVDIHKVHYKPSYLRPTTFGMYFYKDVPQGTAMALLEKYDLKLHRVDQIEKNTFAFYVMRLTYVNTESQADLFKVIRAVSAESEVYSAFPLFVRSGYALKHDPTPMPIKGNDVRHRAEFLNKFSSELEKFYWVAKTAPVTIVKKLAETAVISIKEDSVIVNIRFNTSDPLTVRQIIQKNEVRSLYPISVIEQGYSVVAMAPWSRLEGLAQQNEVTRLSFIGEGAASISY